MKRKIDNKIAIMAMTAVLCLSGCGAESLYKKDEIVIDETVLETVNVTAQTDFDVVKVLEEAESGASALQKKLLEDPSLTQTEMNTLSYEVYQVWDDVLNELWEKLKATLDEATMDSLLKEQRAWITEKEAEVKQAGEEFKGGSIAPLVANQRAAELTRTRVYELASYLGYDDGTMDSSN